ncbi:MAG TPA: flagellar biosynthetic protein FliR [Dongiaceae bacterium]|jgi:flagellar biosynthetic protein FliR|nr:flagellar biosynthetic protein FliR [Dongiaceae bacterium]
MEINFYNPMLVFLRVGAFLFVLPFFSATNFPPTMRIALAALIGLLLGPLLPQFSVEHLTFTALLGVMFRETCIGLLLGFVGRMVFYATDLAGHIIATEMGLNLAAMLNPATNQQSPVPGTILFYLAAVVMLTLDLHHWMLMGFERTYTVLPMGVAHLNAALFENIVGHTSRIFTVGLQISAPAIAVSFVITLVFAVLSRAVPQMNVFAESFAFRVVGGLIVFGFTLQLTAQHVFNYLRRLPDDLLLVAQLLGGR